ncbi:ShlB/FhaC/HecB family hemolysin secretion/activation protein [Bordetella avium]|nr:ShlB/FhaC/HecB family hemolysin secretion/activation protein [Bordetella avium]RIQ37470.1 ShlB/FhaC/HecB family hemolysin secretion/activation protein [Bordetella avium]RIQ38968.1 ShlB/FhaC/HecB family hemolysin secretion/activation protein [Bordetella avium]RIQ40312.1 ShlB/FhaC/HecB family hemolysin secretion/activation protein [Bordetella avium]RIQ46401.1 ShlB/FhaC/HecB family hemolysin secretion/activation protein [Bordetella avium]
MFLVIYIPLRKKMFNKKSRLFLSFIGSVVSLPGFAEGGVGDIGRVINESVERSIERTQQARELAQSVFEGKRLGTIQDIDPALLYSVDNQYQGVWKPPLFDEKSQEMLGVRFIARNSDMPPDLLIKSIAQRIIDRGYVFFKIVVAPDRDGGRPLIVLQPLEVKFLDHGLQLKNIINIRPGDFLSYDRLKLALYQLNQKGESSYTVDVANVDGVVYVSFKEQRRSKLTTYLNINNYSKKDLYGYTGTASLLASDLINLNETLGLSYTGNMASVDARKFESFSGFFSVPIGRFSFGLDYAHSTDKNSLSLANSSLAAQRRTENYGLSLKYNFLWPIADALGTSGVRLYRNNSNFDINSTPILAQTYSYRAAEAFLQAQYRSGVRVANASVSVLRSLSRGDPFSIARAHLEYGDRVSESLAPNFRYRISGNAQSRIGSNDLPSSELFYPNASTRTRVPFSFSTMAGERGFNISSTLSYDNLYSGLHRGWVGVGVISPFVGLDYARSDSLYVSSASIGLNLSMGQNSFQMYFPKVLSTNAGRQDNAGVFLTLQAQF